jgi:14-3-3 protein epsilon
MAQPNLEGLSLHEEEEEGFCFDFEEEENDQVDLRWCLVGRFLCDRSIHFNSMKVRMANLWKPVKGVTIKEALAGKFLFHFNHPLDMEAVLNGGPWTFDNNMLILEQVRIGMQIEHIPLHHVNMWVQIHDLPMGLMKEKIGIQFANYIGAFVEYDKNNNSSFWRQYMRIRVQIDVRRPLKKDTKVKNKEGAWCTVKFKYEKLGVFCFVCGIMGHAENKCEVLFSKEEDDGVRNWSADIRAESRRQGGRITSRWLKDEGEGRTAQVGDESASHANFPAGSSSKGPTSADVESNRHNPFHNRPPSNLSTIIARQGQSLSLNDHQDQPPDPANSHASNQIIPVIDFNAPAIQIESDRHNSPTPLISLADTIITPNPTVTSNFPNLQFKPIILNQFGTEKHETTLLPNQAITFQSQPLLKAPQPLTKPSKKSTRVPTNPNPFQRSTSLSKLDPSVTRLIPDKKPKINRPSNNPTQLVPVPGSVSSHAPENIVDMETQTEKKRRREEESTATDKNEHFLTAGPGSQACRDQ